jgi:hypothetical protein
MTSHLNLLLAKSIAGVCILAVCNLASSDPRALEQLTLRSSVYTDSPVTLRDGEFRKPAAPGSASEIVLKLTDIAAFGQLKGIDIGALVFTTETGGSGTFFELALLTRGERDWENTHSVLLGDRVTVKAVTIATDTIVVDMITHGPNDPRCCPTLESRKRFAVRTGRLVEIAADED